MGVKEAAEKIIQTLLKVQSATMCEIFGLELGGCCGRNHVAGAFVK